MKACLQALNSLVANGVISSYAIGGAVGASFYLDAMQTEDVDAFVFLPPSAGLLISLTPVYEALSKQGGIVEREYVRFGEWPLQILTDYTPLVAEAIRSARSVTFDGVPTRVFTAEHLCAIALDTGRGKDFLRVANFLDQRAVNEAALNTLLERFQLSSHLVTVAPLRRAKK
jgi:hypothetical protein